MSKYHILFLLVLLPGCKGCGNDQTLNNHGFGWSFDEQSQTTGIRVRYPIAGSNLALVGPIHVEQVDRVYAWTASHMQINQIPNGPLVLFIERSKIDAQTHDLRSTGAFFPDTNTILLDDALPNFPVGNSYAVNVQICHESVHSLLQATTGDPDRDHKSPFFNDCFDIFSLAPGQHRY